MIQSTQLLSDLYNSTHKYFLKQNIHNHKQIKPKKNLKLSMHNKNSNINASKCINEYNFFIYECL